MGAQCLTALRELFGGAKGHRWRRPRCREGLQGRNHRNATSVETGVGAVGRRSVCDKVPFLVERARAAMYRYDALSLSTTIGN